MESRDAIAFAQTGIDELKSRIAQQQNSPFNQTVEQIVRKFFSDQGFVFNEDGILQVIASAQAGQDGQVTSNGGTA